MAMLSVIDSIRALHDAGVEFIIVGGLSAVLQGVPVHTYDLDIVHKRTPENVAKLMAVLEQLEAIYRAQPLRRLKPVLSAVSSAGHQNLITKNGPLDVLGQLEDGLGYEQLLTHTEEMLVDDGVRVKVLNLEPLVELKSRLTGEKDRAMFHLLVMTLDEKRRHQKEKGRHEAGPDS